MMVVVLVAALMQGGVTFDSEEGAFSVVFRKRPSCSYFDHSTTDALLERALGGQLKPLSRSTSERPRAYVFTASDDTGDYLVTLTRPALPTPGVRIVSGGGQAHVSGKVVSTTSIRIGQYRGARSVVKTSTGEAHEIHVVGEYGARYHVVASPKSPEHAIEAMRFLGSFRILPTTEKAWCRTTKP